MRAQAMSGNSAHGVREGKTVFRPQTVLVGNARTFGNPSSILGLDSMLTTEFSERVTQQGCGTRLLR